MKAFWKTMLRNPSGMIGLVTTEDNHIRFNINKAAIERPGLRASSQLLQLARLVDETRANRRRR